MWTPLPETLDRIGFPGKDPSRRRDLSVLLLTLVLGTVCGVAQVLTLSAVPTLLPLGILLAGVYLLLAVSRNLGALVIFIFIFAEAWGYFPEPAEFGGAKLIDIVTAIIMVPLGIYLVRSGFPFRGPSAWRLRLATLLLLLLIGGQIILTTVRTDQSLWLSTKAAKPYLYYLAFLLVPAYADGALKIRRLAAWMTGIATGLALLYVLVSLIGPIQSLPGLIVGEANFIALGTFTRVRSNGAPLIVAMLLYQLYRYAAGRASRLEKASLVVLAMGALVHFYRSLWVGILVGVVVQAGIEGRRGARSIAKFLVVLGALSAGIGALHPEYGGMILSRAVSTVTEVEELNGSYGVRHEQIARWTPILKENWLLGIGFLHHDSPLGQQMEALYELEGTGNYDVGWVDLLGRLGVLGVGLLLISLLVLTSSGWQARSYLGEGDAAVLRRAILAYFIVGVISLPGYPLLSCGAGIFPLALLVGMLAVVEQSRGSERNVDAATEFGRGAR